jgi:hypothetical protein
MTLYIQEMQRCVLRITIARWTRENRQNGNQEKGSKEGRKKEKEVS